MAKKRGVVPRLYVQHDLAPQAEITLDRAQTHYARRVMRLAAGDEVLLFNGRDGEWAGAITALGGEAQVRITARRRAPVAPIDLWLLFAPLRGQRSAWLAQKAAELGVAALYPIWTQHGTARRLNLARITANLIEGAEQSESLHVPELHAPRPLRDMLENWPQERQLIFCDEALADTSRKGEGAVQQLSALRERRSFAILIGPEGGFADAERQWALAVSGAQPLRLSRHILRAETAALAALALFHAIIGEWADE